MITPDGFPSSVIVAIAICHDRDNYYARLSGLTVERLPYAEYSGRLPLAAKRPSYG